MYPFLWNGHLQILLPINNCLTLSYLTFDYICFSKKKKKTKNKNKNKTKQKKTFDYIQFLSWHFQSYQILALVDNKS